MHFQQEEGPGRGLLRELRDGSFTALGFRPPPRINHALVHPSYPPPLYCVLYCNLSLVIRDSTSYDRDSSTLNECLGGVKLSTFHSFEFFCRQNIFMFIRPYLCGV